VDHAPLLDAVRSLRWPARRRVGGTLPGAHRARLRGPGGEFSEYRAYRQGDDPRRIDWRLLARSDRAFVRLADDHALLPTVLVVDASASMAFPADGAARHAKWRQAVAVAVGLAAVAQAAGDPVGLAVAADGPAGARALPPRSRRGVVAEIAGALAAAAPAGSAALAPAAGRAPAGCRVVLISDFLGDAAGDDARALRRAGAAHAAAGGDVHAVHVVAAEELAVPRALAVAQDPEDARVRRPMDAAGRAAYGRAFGDWRAELARAWRDAGAAYTLVRADEPPARAVRRVVRGDAPGTGDALGGAAGRGA
jgi:uncharacterized protein (DUF58 family)